jgi:hypothetical protein
MPAFGIFVGVVLGGVHFLCLSFPFLCESVCFRLLISTQILFVAHTVIPINYWCHLVGNVRKAM